MAAGPSNEKLAAVLRTPGRDGTLESCMLCPHHFEPGETYVIGKRGRKLLRVCRACADRGDISETLGLAQIRPKWTQYLGWQNGPVKGNA